MSVCALVPTDALSRAIDADPGTGVEDEGAFGRECVWTLDDAHVYAQYTGDPSGVLSDVAFPAPDDALPVDGATRGWASQSMQTVLVVVGAQGVLLTYVDVAPDKRGTPEAWAALGGAIAANL